MENSRNDKKCHLHKKFVIYHHWWLIIQGNESAKRKEKSKTSKYSICKTIYWFDNFIIPVFI